MILICKYAKLLILFMMLINHDVYAQINIINKSTSQHVEIPNTGISFIPPKGFTLSKDFKGFQNSATFATLDIIKSSTPYEEYTKKVIPIMSNSTEIKMIEKESYIINHNSAKLYFGTHLIPNTNKTLSKLFLVVKDKNETICVNAVYKPQKNNDYFNLANIDKEILSSMLSIRTEEAFEANNSYDMGFTVDLANTDYSFLKKSGNAYTFSNQKTKNAPPPSFILMKKTFVYKTDAKTATLNNILQVFNIEYQVYEKEITINGLKGIETLLNLTGKTSKTPTQGYLITVIDKNEYYFLVGYNIDETSIKEMRKIFSTLKKE